MKRLIALVAALLCSFLAFSQEASSGNSTELTIVPRFDVNPIFPLADDGQSGVNFGNSMLATLLEGSVGDHFSYSVFNVWANSDIESLYTGLFHNDTYNWLGWANATLSYGNFDFSFGKDFIQIANYENDQYDYDVYSELAPSIWNNLQTYQWGGKVNYNFDEDAYASLQIQSSPYNPGFFDGKLFSYTAAARAPFACGEIMGSMNFVEYTYHKFVRIYSVATDQFFDNFEVTFNGMINRSNVYEAELIPPGIIKTSAPTKTNFALFGKLAYHFSEKSNLFFKGGIEKNNSMFDIIGTGDDYELWGIFPSALIQNKAYCYGGIGFETRPFKNAKNLRLHAVSAINNYAKALLSLNFGATYYFSISK